MNAKISTSDKIKYQSQIESRVKKAIESWSFYNLIDKSEQQFIQNCFSELSYNVFKNNNEEMLATVIDWIKKFHYLPMQTYPSLFKIATNEFIGDYIDNLSYITVYPGALPSSNYQKNNQQHIKSYQTVMYMFRSTLFQNICRTNKIDTRVEIRGDFNFDYGDDNSTITIFVDDFIGTGESLLASLKYWKKESNNPVIISLAITEFAYQRLTENGYKIFYGEKIESVSPREIELAKKIQLNKDDISDDLKDLGIKFRNKLNWYQNNEFKQHKSDILASLIRTPNNAFPFFEKNKPFKREK